MKITLKWLKENWAYREGSDWFFAQKETDSIKVVRKLLEENHFKWANWLIVRLMTHDQKIQYAIFAAEQGLRLYEKKYPKDKRPRKAIEAAKKYIAEPSEENKNAAYTAAYAAYTAAYTATYAAYAAYAAYDADDADAADAAAYAVYTAAYAATYAADAADDADAIAKIQKRIVENGIKILQGKL